MGRCLAALLLLLAACSEPVADTTTVTVAIPGSPSPEQAVAALFRNLNTGDFEAAAELTVPGQMVVVAMAEGSSVATGNDLLAEGSLQVGARFWESFTDSLTGFLGYEADEVFIEGVTRYVAAGTDFAVLDVLIPLEPGVRRIVTREGDGWHIDVIASFAPALVPKLTAAGELVRADPAGGDLLEAMRDQEPSLELILTEPGLGAQMQQAVFQALEVLRR